MFANPHRVQGFEGFSPSVFLFFPPAIGMSVPRGTNRHSCRLERQTELRGLEPPISPPFGCARSHLRPSIRLFSPKGTPSHWALYSEGCFVLQKEMEAKRQDSNLLPVPPFGGSRPSNITDLLDSTCTVINHNPCARCFSISDKTRGLCHCRCDILPFLPSWRDLVRGHLRSEGLFKMRRIGEGVEPCNMLPFQEAPLPMRPSIHLFVEGSASILDTSALICLPPMLNMLQLLLTSAHLFR